MQSKSYLPSAIHGMYLLKVEMMPYAYWLLKKSQAISMVVFKLVKKRVGRAHHFVCYLLTTKPSNQPSELMT